MNKTLTTYKEVSEEAGLGKIESARFIAYMTMRWQTEEEIQCMSGYAKEWAERFRGEREYQSSDLEGLKVLRAIDTCENCRERLTDDEMLEAIETGLKLGEVACDKCYQNFVSQKTDETKHPNEK